MLAQLIDGSPLEAIVGITTSPFSHWTLALDCMARSHLILLLLARRPPFPLLLFGHSVTLLVTFYCFSFCSFGLIRALSSLGNPSTYIALQSSGVFLNHSFPHYCHLFFFSLCQLSSSSYSCFFSIHRFSIAILCMSNLQDEHNISLSFSLFAWAPTVAFRGLFPSHVVLLATLCVPSTTCSWT